jgi:hypothetical protein
MATVHEIYDNSIRGLPTSEKLRLATMILDELNQSAASALDYRDEWTEEDVRDLTAFAQQHAAKQFPE